jgi:hypothetical protein
MSPTKPDRDRVRQDMLRAKSRACASFSLTSRGLLTGSSSWQVQILNTIVMFYSEWVKMCKDFTLNSGDKETCYCIRTTHRLTLPFSPEDFWPKITWRSSSPPPPYSPNHSPDHASVSRPVDTLEVMDAALGKVHTGGRGLPQRCQWLLVRKSVFDLMTAPVPEIMDSCVTHIYEHKRNIKHCHSWYDYMLPSLTWESYCLQGYQCFGEAYSFHFDEYLYIQTQIQSRRTKPDQVNYIIFHLQGQPLWCSGQNPCL